MGAQHSPRYWEDLAQLAAQPPERCGPVVIPTARLDAFLEITGERHPIHADPQFAAQAGRRDRVVPGGLLHSATTGWGVEHGAALAVIGMRSMHWDFVRPVYPDTQLWFTSTFQNPVAIDPRIGVVEVTRKVIDAEEQTLAIGRLSLVMMRRQP
jgi:acyl dehydratase